MNKFFNKYLLNLIILVMIIFIFSATSFADVTDQASLFNAIDNGDVTLQPNTSFFDQGGNHYYYREVSTNLEVVFNFTFNSSEVSNIEDGLDDESGLRVGKDPTAGSAIGKDASVVADPATNTITATFSNINDNIDINKELKIYVNDGTGTFQQIASFEQKPQFTKPTINLELKKYPELGTLEKDKIYYLPDTPGDLTYSFISEGEISNVGWRKARSPKINQTVTDVTANSFIQLSDYINMEEALNGNFDSAGSSVPDAEEYEIPKDKPTGNSLQDLASKYADLKFHAFRIRAKSRGAQGWAVANYYFVEDNGEPEIKPLDQDGNEKTEKKFDHYRNRRPQLKVRINDDVSGIKSREDINAKIIPMPSGNDENNLPLPGEFSNANQLDVIELSERDNGKQTATFVPYSQLGEGEYAVRVTAVDRAGNSSVNDDDGDGDFDKPYVFYLKIDQTGPRINNVSVNNKVIDVTEDTFVEDPQPVNADNLEMYFEGYGSEELLYGIRYIGDEDDDTDDSNWLLLRQEDIGYVSQYITKDFLNHPGAGGMFTEDSAAKNGVYEVFIIADEKGIGSDGDDLDTELGGSSYASIEPSGIIFKEDLEEAGSYIGNLIQGAKGSESEARTYVHFQIEVDGNPPQYKEDSLKYYENYPSGINDLVDDGNADKLYQGQPVFEAVLINSSAIRRDDINIYFENQEDGRVLAGDVITPPKVSENETTGNTEHTIQFQPVINLNPGIYTLRINATDEFGNSTQLGQIEFTDSFEIISTTSGQLEFSITDGERLNINQSSALEIRIPNEDLKPKESLRIAVNGAPIVASGNIVDERITTESGNQQILTKPDDYYKKEKLDPDKHYYEEEQDFADNQNNYQDGYQSDAFDVFFFNDKRRIVIFSRLPLPAGRNKVAVEVVDNNGVVTTDSIEFMVDNYRHGFGFGRLLPKSD